eukprot:2859165-Rhodomonas_salina.1
MMDEQAKVRSALARYLMSGKHTTPTTLRELYTMSGTGSLHYYASTRPSSEQERHWEVMCLRERERSWAMGPIA